MNRVKYYNSDGKVRVILVAQKPQQPTKSGDRLPTRAEADAWMHSKGYSRRGGTYTKTIHRLHGAAIPRPSNE